MFGSVQNQVPVFCFHCRFIIFFFISEVGHIQSVHYKIMLIFSIKFFLFPGLSTCQKRYEESFLFPSLGRFVPSCKKDGRFHERQCHQSTGHCWCVDSYGTELLGTRTRGRPNCTVPGKKMATQNPYFWLQC